MRKSEILFFTEDASNAIFRIVDRGKSSMVSCLHKLLQRGI